MLIIKAALLSVGEAWYLKKKSMKGFLLPLSIKEGSIFSVDVASWKKEI